MKTDTPLNFDFSDPPPKAKETIKESATKPEVVHHTPFDQDERFSIVKAEQSFAVIKDKLIVMSEKAKGLDVKDDDTNTVAMEMLVQCKALVKTADKSKKAIPAYKAAAKFKAGVDTFVRESIRKPIERIERVINPKVGSYQKAQAELQRRIDQKKAEEEAERIAKETKEAEEKAQQEHELKVQEANALQVKLNKEADEADVDRVKVDMPEFEAPEIIAPSNVVPIVKKDEKVTTDQGKATVASKWVCIVIDPDKVPREYCQPNQKSLDAAVEAGARSIHGCRIEEQFETKVRMSSKRTQMPFGDDDGG